MQKDVGPILPPEGFVRLPVVVKIMGVGKTTWWCGVREGRFPKPVKLGPKTSAWRVEDIRALITSFKNDDPSAGAASRKEKIHG
jgi:predicted DNA-binding transcriptional regulator AlpA